MKDITLIEAYDTLYKEALSDPLNYLLSVIKQHLPTTTVNVFVSYAWPKLPSEQDIQRFLIRLREHLLKAGITIQLDLFNLQPGVDIQNYMQSGIKSSTHILMVGTPSYKIRAQSATSVAKEIEHFKQKNSDNIIPLLYTSTPEEAFPTDYGKQPFFDFSPDKHHYFRLLPDVILTLLGWQQRDIVPKKVQEQILRYQHTLDDFESTLSEERVVAFMRQEAQRLEAEKLAAISSLGQLVDSIYRFHPDYQGYPDICYVPTRNPIFTGREVELANLVKLLQFNGSDTTARVAVISGEAGSGKTQLAIAFAQRYGGRFSLVWCLDASSLKTFQQSYAALAKVLFPNLNIEPSEGTIELVNNYLAQPSSANWLLLVDRLQGDPEKTIAQLPNKGGCVIITTTQQLSLPEIKNLEIGAFSKEDAITLLSKITKNTDAEIESIKKIASMMQYFPLFIAKAGNYIAQNRLTLNVFIRFYEQRGKDLLNNTHLSDYDEAIISFPTEDDVTVTNEATQANSHVLTVNENMRLSKLRLANGPLQNLLKVIKDEATTKPCVYASYSWPQTSEESDIQLFLLMLRQHLLAAGITLQMDLFDLKSFQNVEDFYQEVIKNSTHILLIGTPSYKQHLSEDGHYLKEEFSCIEKKRTEAGGGDQIIPLLYAGTFTTSFTLEHSDLLISDYRPEQEQYLVELPKLLCRLFGWYGNNPIPAAVQQAMVVYTEAVKKLEVGMQLATDGTELAYKQEARLARDEQIALKAEIGQRIDELQQSHPQYHLLPAVWMMPTQNFDFIERKSLLVALSEKLSMVSPEEPIRYCVLFAPGGFGKSQAAKGFVYRHYSRFQHVIAWIDCSSPLAFYQSYGALAKQLKIETEQKGLEQIVKEVNYWLEQPNHANWLMVADNAEDPDWLQQRLPKRCGCVLVTTRRHDWEKFPVVDATVMERTESVHLLTKISGDNDVQTAEEIATLVDDLPLALAQIAYYARSKQITLKAYKQLYQETDNRLLGEVKLRDSLQIVANCWNISMKAIEQELPIALKWLQIMSYLAPRNIPIHLLFYWLQFDGKKEQVLLYEMMGKIIKLLVNYGLIQEGILNNLPPAPYQEKARTQGFISLDSKIEIQNIDSAMLNKVLFLHRIIQQAIRDQIEAKGEFETICVHNVYRTCLMLKAEEFNPELPETWPDALLMAPHFLNFAQYIGSKEKGEYPRLLKKAVKLYNIAGSIQSVYSLYEEGLNTYKQALAWILRIQGENSLEAAVANNHIGKNLSYLGRNEEAVTVLETALRIIRKNKEINHPRLLSGILSNLSCVYSELKNQKKAVLCLEEAKRINLASGNQEDAARDLSNQALLIYQENKEEAMRLINKALGILRQQGLHEHPDFATVLHNKAAFLIQQELYQEAISILQQALTIESNVFGENSEQSAFSLQFMAKAYCAIDNFEKSMHYLMKRINISVPNEEDTFYLVEFIMSYRGQVTDKSLLLPFYKQYLANVINWISQQKKKTISSEDLFKHAHNLNAFAADLVAYKFFEDALKFYGQVNIIYELLFPGKKYLNKNTEMKGKIKDSIAENFCEFANALRCVGNYQDSIQQYYNAIAIYKTLNQGLDGLHIRALHSLGDVLLESGQLSEALQTYQHAYSLSQQFVMNKKVWQKASLEHLIKYYELCHEKEKADKYKAELQTLNSASPLPERVNLRDSSSKQVIINGEQSTSVNLASKAIVVKTSAKGNFLAIACIHPQLTQVTVCIYDLKHDTKTYLPLPQASSIKEIACIAISPDEKQLAVAHDATISLWDCAIYQLQTIIETNKVTCMSYSCDSRRLCVATDKGDLTTWSVNPSSVSFPYAIGGVMFSPGARVMSIAYHPTNNKLFFTAHEDKDVCEFIEGLSYDFNSPLKFDAIFARAEMLGFLSLSNGHDAQNISHVCYNFDGTQVVIAGAKGLVILINCFQMQGMINKQAWIRHVEQNVFTLREDHDTEITSLAFHPSEHLLAISNSRSDIAIWNSDTKQKVGSLRGHTASSMDIGFTADGQCLFSIDQNGILQKWNLSSLLGVQQHLKDDLINQEDTGNKSSSAQTIELGPTAFIMEEDSNNPEKPTANNRGCCVIS